MIQFNNGHSTVIGLTRSGKTYATQKSLLDYKNERRGVLFFNTQHETMPYYTKATGYTNMKELIASLKRGEKINYLPNTDIDIRQSELEYIINQLYKVQGLNIVLAVDEVHLYEKEALKALVRVATTGLRYGITGVWISQRPANIDNTLMTQSNQFIIFKTNMENGYMKRYGIPGEEIKEKLEGKKYNYCVYDFNELKGPFRV